MCGYRGAGQRNPDDAESTAQQWSAILSGMHALGASRSTPLPAAAIARHVGMETAVVERHLRLMARVGLVRLARRGLRKGWLLGGEP
jgi:hypothetical protein